eukprot:m.659051 g.659051  ORF g.659051 m.659051 type:complete len:654 (-) comp22721_c0_seq7:1665-3626(-)
MDASGGSGDAHEASSENGPFTFPSVLHYLHREWIKFERERKWWLAEKAELQARIAFLEGQRLGEANLKRDLLRRIKMLEHALRTERCNNGGGEKSEEIAPFVNTEEKSDSSSNIVKEGRQILLQYLSEMQYTDAVIEAQAQRVRGMLDSWSPPTIPGGGGTGANASAEHQAGYSDQKNEFHPKDSLTFIPTDDGGEEGDDETDERVQGEESITESDFDMGEYLEIAGADAETDVAADQDASQEFNMQNVMQAKSSGEQLEVDTIDPNADQDIPEELPLGPRKSQHKAAPAAGAGAGQAPDNDDDDDNGSTSGNSDIHLHANILKHFGAAGGKMMRKQGRKSKSRGRASMDMFTSPKEEENLEEKLGELSDVTLSEEKPTSKGRDSAKKPAEDRADEVPSKTWRTKMELKGHLDGVRNVVFHPHEPLMVSVGEDALVAIWRAPAKFGGKIISSSDPVRLLRGHTGPVYAVSIAPTSGMLFTGGADGKLISWLLPDEGSERFPEHNGSGARISVNTDYSDCIWALDCHATRDVLFSGGVDGVCRLWDTSGEVGGRVGDALDFESQPHTLSLSIFATHVNGLRFGSLWNNRACAAMNLQGRVCHLRSELRTLGFRPVALFVLNKVNRRYNNVCHGYLLHINVLCPLAKCDVCIGCE